MRIRETNSQESVTQTLVSANSDAVGWDHPAPACHRWTGWYPSSLWIRPERPGSPLWVSYFFRPWQRKLNSAQPFYDKDFKWPSAPTNDGGQADLRVIPTDHNWLDLASCQMDPRRRL